jgi:hypothetical protein
VCSAGAGVVVLMMVRGDDGDDDGGHVAPTVGRSRVSRHADN